MARRSDGFVPAGTRSRVGDLRDRRTDAEHGDDNAGRHGDVDPPRLVVVGAVQLRFVYLEVTHAAPATTSEGFGFNVFAADDLARVKGGTGADAQDEDRLRGLFASASGVSTRPSRILRPLRDRYPLARAPSTRRAIAQLPVVAVSNSTSSGADRHGGSGESVQLIRLIAATRQLRSRLSKSPRPVRGGGETHHRPPRRTTMGKLTVTSFITLDNVVEDPHQWSGEFQSEDTGALNDAVLKEADILLLGRATYEGFAAAWPRAPATGSRTSSTRCRSTSSPRPSRRPTGTTRRSSTRTRSSAFGRSRQDTEPARLGQPDARAEPAGRGPRRRARAAVLADRPRRGHPPVHRGGRAAQPARSPRRPCSAAGCSPCACRRARVAS